MRITCLRACSAVMMITALPFIGAAGYGLINLDDYAYVCAHDLILKWAGIESIRHFFNSVDDGIWMPLTYASYAVDWLVFDDWYGGFHLHSIAIHVINSALLFLLIKIVVASTDGYKENKVGVLLASFCTTLFWAVHPLRCESVVLLSSRKDVLSFFWELLALIFWFKGGFKRTVVSLACFMLGSLCKPSVMTFPALCLLLDVFIKREIRILRYIAPLVYAAFLGIFTYWQQSMGDATVDIFGQPIWAQILGAFAAFGIYIRNAICPLWLAPQCMKIWPQLPRFWFQGTVITVSVAYFLYRSALKLWTNRRSLVTIETKEDMPVAVRFAHPQNLLILGLGWFVIAIAPMLGIVSFGYHAFADRFTYIPCVGLSFAILGVIGRVKGRLQTLGMATVALFTVWLGWQTAKQTEFWEDDGKLFNHTLAVDGNQNTIAHWSLANYYWEFPHDLQQCVREFELAMDQNVTFVLPTYHVYIMALCELNQVDKASRQIKLLEDAIVKLYGWESARAIITGSEGLKAKEEYLHGLYRKCKVAQWLSMPEAIESAASSMQELSSDERNADATWLYLGWQLALRKGNQVEAESNRMKLKSLKAGGSYIRCRFCRN